MFFSTCGNQRLFFLFLTLLFFLLLATPSVIHSEVTMDGTLGPQIELIGPNYEIQAEYGKIVNNYNLFHSFGKFDIDTGQSATFNGPESIQNIIGRITGGTLSNIDGIIRTEIPSANFYLLNPSGFLFGPNAELDVNGSFHITSADHIFLGDNGIFHSDPAKTSLLSVDPPAAFGFINITPGEIILNQSWLEVPEGQNLSLVGGNIQITGLDSSNQAALVAPAGRIDIASVSSGGVIIPDYSIEAPDLISDSFENMGDTNLYHGFIDAGGKGGGTVFIRSGQLTIDSSCVYASTKGEGSTTPGAGIDIKASGNMLVDNSAGTETAIGTNIFDNVNEDSGGVRISADHLEVKNSSGIRSVAFPGSSGRSGDIVLNTNSLVIENSGNIQAGSGGSVESGNIIINTGSLEIRDNGVVWTNAFDGSGNGGDIHVTADNLLLSNEKYPGYLTGITTQTYWPGTGQGGDITLTAKNLQMLPGTEISSPSFYLGQAGNITVNIEEKGSITGTEGFLTGIFANTFWSSSGGDLEITAKQFDMNMHASIQVSAYSTGDAGNVSLTVDTLEVKDGSYIASTGLFGEGGGSGNVEIIAENIKMAGFESSVDPFGNDFSGISTVSGYSGGRGGDISIQTTNLEMSNRSSINSNSFGPDQGGDIILRAENIDVYNGSVITAGAYGSGEGGLVEVTADNLLVSGVHPELYQDAKTGQESLALSGIASQAGLNGGKGGNLNIEAGSIQVMDGGILAADTFGSGDAGDINIVSEHLIVSGENMDLQNFLTNPDGNTNRAGSKITASTSSTFLGDLATGNGGNITINTEDLMLKEGGIITSATTTPGKGGNIEISARKADFFSDAFISATSRISGTAGKAGNIEISIDENLTLDNAYLLTSSAQAMGGDINIQSDRMELTHATLISAQSRGQGDAGNISLEGQHFFFMDNSQVTTDARQADGGNIKVYADYMTRLVDSEITASVGGGSQTTGGNISIDPQYVILKNSNVIANAFEGKGGNIEIVSDVFLADPDSMIDASSSLGIDGQVDIRSPVKHVSGLVSPLSNDFRNVVALLRKPCMARVHKGEYSSFMIKGRDSLPVEPGRSLSSPLPIE